MKRRTYKITVADNPCFRKLFGTIRDHRRDVKAVFDRLDPVGKPAVYFSKDIIKMRENGATLQKIADKYGVSRQRIDQILRSRKG